MSEEKLNDIENNKLLAKGSLSGLRFLAIDDDPVSRDLLAHILGTCKAEVDFAESPEKIMDLLQRSVYHLVLLDIHMPGTNGFDIVDMIRTSKDTLFKDIPIIALTADALPATRKKMLQFGISDYMYKPIDFIALTSGIVSILNLESETAPAQVMEDKWKIHTEYINPAYLFNNYGSSKAEILKMLVKTAGKLNEYSRFLLLAYKTKNERELLYNAHKLVTIAEILGIKSLRGKLSEMQELVVLQKSTESVFTCIEFINNVKQRAFKEVKDLIEHITKN